MLVREGASSCRLAANHPLPPLTCKAVPRSISRLPILPRRARPPVFSRWLHLRLSTLRASRSIPSWPQSPELLRSLRRGFTDRMPRRRDWRTSTMGIGITIRLTVPVSRFSTMVFSTNSPSLRAIRPATRRTLPMSAGIARPRPIPHHTGQSPPLRLGIARSLTPKGIRFSSTG